MSIIVMPCRNCLALSKQALKTLLAQIPDHCQTPAWYDILIVNNASTDGTAAWIRAEQRKGTDDAIAAMHFPEVQSVATMWNRALRWAWRHGHEDALVVNNDTELLPETYATLLRERQGAGMITCISVRSREELVLPTEFTRRPHPDFSCFLLTKQAFEAVGGFDEHCIGAYYEDNCFHVEAHRKGIRCEGISLPFVHHGAGTLRESDLEERRRVERNAARNREYFIGKYGAIPGTKAYERLFTEAGE